MKDTNTNDTMMLNAMNDQGIFTLVFRDGEMLEEFKNRVSMFNRKSEELVVREIGESGRTFEVERVNGKPTCWELAMHKYMSLSKSTVTDKVTGKKYEPVVFTPWRFMVTQEEAVG